MWLDQELLSALCLAQWIPASPIVFWFSKFGKPLVPAKGHGIMGTGLFNRKAIGGREFREFERFAYPGAVDISSPTGFATSVWG